MRKLSWKFAVSVCVVAFGLVSGCGDSGDKPKAAASSGSAAPGAEKVTLNMTSVFPTSLALVGEGAVIFADKIKRVSNDTLELKVFEPGALVPALEAIPAVSKGSVATAWSTPGFFAGTDPTFNFFTTVPFGPDAPEFLAWMYYGGGIQLADELFAEHNIKAIPCGITPPEASGWFREKINTLDDLKGLKMRFFGLGAKVMDKLGVATQLLAPGDIFQALQLGTIDATEFSMPSMDESFGFYQVAKYYYFPGWHQPSSILDFFVNMDVWNSLSDYHKTVIEVTCGDMVRDIMVKGEATQAPAMRRMRDDHGVHIEYWSPEILAAYRKAWNEVSQELADSNPKFKKVYASYSKFRKEFKLWGENGYLKR
jgi:TRAP-type mannitol/chloroaromatic compound transport system substrate-binding protein